MPSRMGPARLEDSPEQVADLAAKLNAACGAQLAPRSAVVARSVFPRDEQGDPYYQRETGSPLAQRSSRSHSIAKPSVRTVPVCGRGHTP